MAAEAKYKVGQKVRVKIDHGRGQKWEWAGEVTMARNVGETGDSDWEYEVSNAPSIVGKSFPLLAWESEVTAL